MNIDLSPEDIATLKRLQKTTKSPKVYQKATTVLGIHQGHSMELLAMLLGTDRSTLYRYAKVYMEEGIDSLTSEKYVPKQSFLTRAQEEALAVEIGQNLYSDAKSIIAWVETKFGVSYSASGMLKVLHRLGFVYKKTKSVPAKADAEAQEAFLEGLDKLRAKQGEENSVFYYLDGVHPTHNTRSMYVWVQRGEEKHIPTNSGRDRVNINGALNADCPTEVEVVECKSVNAQSTQALFEKLLAKHPDEDIIYVICDNARYYKNKALNEWLARHEKIVPLYLPPYSPNLNLIERLWKFMRKKVIDPVFYVNREAFRASLLSFFDDIARYEGELSTLLTLNFRVVPAVC